VSSDTSLFSHERLDRRVAAPFQLAPIDVKHRVPEQNILEAKASRPRA
jgi:hypothetical protein